MNISDIAKMAGVSRAAVSRYFNNGYISEEKREKIQEVVKETGYVPSMQAQNLRTKKTMMLGVIIPKINSDAIARVVAGISDVICQTDYQLLLANTDNQVKKELEYLNLFDSKRVDGILFSATMFTKEHHQILKNLDVPVVIVGQQLTGYSCVSHDEYHAVKKLTELMMERGSKNLVYLGVTTQDKAAGAQRQSGFEDVLKKANISDVENRVCITGFSMEGGYNGAAEMLERMPKLDGIVCATDNIAIGAMTYCREHGIKIPEQIQIAGVGDNASTRVTTPKLTSAHLAYKTSGQEAAKLLLDMLGDNQMPEREVKMGYSIIERESTRSESRSR